MGELLAQLRQYISPGLIDGPGWERLLERARETPVTMAAFPFGFEIPLHDPRPRADFGVSLVGASRSAAFYQERYRSAESEPSLAALAWMLDETDREKSLLRRIVGRKMLLEYDIEADAESARSDPGLFLYPVGDELAGGGERLTELGAVHDALAHMCGWPLDIAENKQIERAYLALRPNVLIKSAGAFPSRRRAVRIAATGFRKAADVVGYLERAGWPGKASAAGALVSPFEKRGAFAYLGVHFDIAAAGVGPTLGLSFFARENEWLKDIRHWTGIIDGMRGKSYAVEEKLTELAERSTGSAILWGKAGPYFLVRGIHHVKITMSGDRVEQAKAYIFFLMMRAWRPRGEKSGQE